MSSEEIKTTDQEKEQKKVFTTRDHEIGRTTRRVHKIFKFVFYAVFVAWLFTSIYWLVASDRYISDAVVLVQNTDSSGTTDASDLLNMFNGNIGSKADQLILVEYLTSLDMLKKLDQRFDLRTHFSNKKIDFFSRLWDRDLSIEWFYWYFKHRVDVVYDDFNGVIRVSAQAFDPKVAHEITSFLVAEGESFMNALSHSTAREQVEFLDEQVKQAKKDLLDANKALIDFQNNKKMSSPTVEVENYQKIIADLEAKRTDLLIKMSELPKGINSSNPIQSTLKQSLNAIDQQLENIRSKIASVNQISLNDLVDQEKLLKLDVDFTKEIYTSALTGLAKGKMNAARLIKSVSILQKPSIPEYPMKPERTYAIVATFFVSLLILGMLWLLKAVILDHVD